MTQIYCDLCGKPIPQGHGARTITVGEGEEYDTHEACYRVFVDTLKQSRRERLGSDD